MSSSIEKVKKKNKTLSQNIVNEESNFPIDDTTTTKNDMSTNNDENDIAFRDYDPEKDTRKYHVYRNDIKYRNHRDIDPSRAIWDDDVKNDFHCKDTDSVEYRIEECCREKYSILDLSHMKSDCIQKLFSNEKFLSIMTNVQHMFAKECELRTLPDLSMMVSLQTLDVSCNKLRELPNLPQTLEELIVDNNRLTQITNHLPNLLRLNCDNNMIERIRFSSKLERIHAKNNPISDIPSLKHLYFLDVSTSKVVHINSFPKLKHLDVSYTNVSAVKELESLEHLQCNFSGVTEITELPKIQTIEMVETNVNCIPYMPSLCRLTYTDAKKIKLSNRYMIRTIKKNKNNINELVFSLESR